MTDKVQLMIRSALTNVDKQIDGTLDWTVLQVKQTIEEDLPHHPPPQDQRLVYAGKLLQDSSRLREVLRLEDLPQPFIIHLVCRQISPPPTSNHSPKTTTTDGIRKRPVAASQAATQQPTSSSTNASGPSLPGSTGFPMGQSYYGAQPTLEGQSYGVDQAVAMQQMYAHYMNQYMQYLQSAGGPFAATGIPTWNAGVTAQAVVPEPRQPDAPHVLEPMAAAAAAATAAVAGGGQAVTANNHGAAEAEQVAAQPQPQGGVAVGPNVGAVGPNPPNVVMNANAGGLGAIEDDDEGGAAGQRDILDWFYVASRVLVLFSIVYFYSSLARFALVAGVGVVLYLYQFGFFGQPRGAQERPAQAVQVQGPQEPRPPVVEGGEQDDLIRRQVDEVRNMAGGGQAEEVTEPAAIAGPSFVNVASTFITTFFSSLIPNEPQIV